MTLGIFSPTFRTDYTIGGPVAPVATVVSATPNPLASTDPSLAFVWTSSENASYVVSVGGTNLHAGTVTAATPTTTTLTRAAFAVGLNTVTVTVTNTNGTGTASTVVTLGPPVPPPTGPALCVSTASFEIPREDNDAAHIPNALSRHVRQDRQATNLFILRSGRVVVDWITPDDPIRVSIFGANKAHKLTEADAALVTAAGYGNLLVQCAPPPLLGFGLDPFGLASFGDTT